MQDEEQLKLSTQQAALLKQQLSEAQWHGSAADTDKSLADNPGMLLSSLMHMCMQDEEQLKLSTQQAALLKQQLSEGQCEASAAAQRSRRLMISMCCCQV